MIEFVVTEMKSGILIHMEDADRMHRETIRLSYREAAGLKHLLDEKLKHPAFQEREPRPRSYHKSEGRSVVTHIRIEDDGD